MYHKFINYAICTALIKHELPHEFFAGLCVGNILLTEDMTLVKIADLGSSKYFEPYVEMLRVSKLTKVPGSSCFMPPEALEDPATYDFTLDCFSFGIMILAIWNHEYPPCFSSKSKAHLSGMREVAIRKPYFDCLEEHPDLSDLVKVCISDNKEDRPSSSNILSDLNHKVKRLKQGSILIILILSAFIIQMGGSLFDSSTDALKTACIVSVDIGLSTLRVAYRVGDEDAKPLYLDEYQMNGAVRPSQE